MEKETQKVFISEADQYMFSQGTHYDIYKKLGAHFSVEKGESKGRTCTHVVCLSLMWERGQCISS